MHEGSLGQCVQGLALRSRLHAISHVSWPSTLLFLAKIGAPLHWQTSHMIWWGRAWCLALLLLPGDYQGMRANRAELITPIHLASASHMRISQHVHAAPAACPAEAVNAQLHGSHNLLATSEWTQ